ncbi:MAG: hypothetical protein PVI86_14890 [Phycisphaerae bacterium]|jgi:predicted RNA-binding Zn-ribbon protein involved in translation (DUF1610 family)
MIRKLAIVLLVVCALGLVAGSVASFVNGDSVYFYRETAQHGSSFMLVVDGLELRVWHWLSVPNTRTPRKFEVSLLGFGLMSEASNTPIPSGLVTHRVSGPAWLLALILGGYPVVSFFRGPVRVWRRRRLGSCVTCGYDLTGNVSGICPECGTEGVGRSCEAGALMRSYLQRRRRDRWILLRRFAIVALVLASLTAAAANVLSYTVPVRYRGLRLLSTELQGGRGTRLYSSEGQIGVSFSYTVTSATRITSSKGTFLGVRFRVDVFTDGPSFSLPGWMVSPGGTAPSVPADSQVTIDPAELLALLAASGAGASAGPSQPGSPAASGVAGLLPPIPTSVSQVAWVDARAPLWPLLVLLLVCLALVVLISRILRRRRRVDGASSS